MLTKGNLPLHDQMSCRQASRARILNHPLMRAPAPATPPAPTKPLKRWWRVLLFPALLILNFGLIQLLAPGQAPRVEVSYTFFKQQVEADNVAEISTRADTVQGTFKVAVSYQPNSTV